MKKENGSATIFVIVCILPLLFILFSVTLDVSSYLKEMRNINQELDTAALQAYRFMPDETAVTEAVRTYVARHLGDDSGTVSCKIDDDVITLTYSGKKKIAFANFFGYEGIPVEVISSVRGSVSDVMIMLDAGYRYYPRHGAWEVDGTWDIPTYFENEEDPLISSQRCYSPVFNPAKVAALTIIDSFKNNSMNSVGALVYPGSESQNVYTITSPIPGGTQQVAWPANVPLQITCAAIAQNSTNPHYAFPYNQSKILVNGYEQLNFSEDVPTISDVIWTYPVQDRVGDFAQSLSVMWQQLKNTSFGRGGLTTSVQKKGVVIASDLPCANGHCYPDSQAKEIINNRLSLLKANIEKEKMNLKIYYVLWGSQANGMLGDTSNSHVAALAADMSGFNVENSDSSFQVRVIYAENFDTLINNHLLDGIILDQKAAVIAR